MYFSSKKIPKSKEIMNELIEKHFEENLTEEEKMKFNKLLEEDSQFKEEFEFYNELKNAVVVSERQKIKKEIQQFENVANKPVFNLRRFFPYAAILLVMLSLWFVFFNPNLNNTDLYTTYFEAYPNTEISNTRSDMNDKSVIEEAFIAYDLEEYARANELFDVSLKISKVDYIQFYKANCLMKLDQHREALELFKSVNWSEAYSEKSLWFTSLCYLKLNQKEEAKKGFTQLSEKGTFKNSEARELLSKL